MDIIHSIYLICETPHHLVFVSFVVQITEPTCNWLIQSIHLNKGRWIEMTRKLTVSIILTVIAALAVSITGFAVTPTPQGFDKYIVYMAAGRYNADVAPVEGDLSMWYHKDVMGRSDEEIAEVHAEADAYFEKQFGPNLPSAMPFAFDPRDEYRVYVSSGEEVPSEGWVIRDGGFMVMLMEDTVLYGEYGGEQGKFVPAGSMLVYGDYNIDRTPSGKDPMIIHYHSAAPIMMHPYEPGFKIDCTIISEEFGIGRAQGFSSPLIVDGMTQVNIRTVLTFPAYGPSIQH
jgi:hypothetical protein